MQLEISATVDRQKIDILAGRTRDPRPAFNRISDQFVTAEKRRFNSSAIKDIKTSTIQRKNRDSDPRVRANSYKPLMGTGNLFAALTARGSGGQPYRVTRSGADFGIPRTSKVARYASIQAHSGRDPMVPASAIRRIATPTIRDYILGGS